MRFRRTAFLGIAAAIVAVAALQAVLDVAVERLAAARERTVASVVGEALDALEEAVAAGRPLLAAAEAAARGRRFHATVDASGGRRVAGRPAEGVPDTWLVGQRGLPGGGAIRVALEPTSWEALLGRRVLLDLIAIPIFVAAALLIAWYLSSVVARPLRHLTTEVERLTARRLVGSVPVPPGDDELSGLAEAIDGVVASARRMTERERAFTRYAAHELRTPLAAMGLQLERAEMGSTSAERVLPVLQRHIHRLEGILTALARLARADADDGEILPLDALVAEAVEASGADPGAVEIQFRAPVAARISHGRLVQQAVANLLDNAVRHGGGTALLEVEAGDTDLVVRVRDHGPGAPEEDLGRLTEPFFRGGDGADDGLGLGLSLVSAVAEATHGSLTLRNATPGLEAMLRLPVVAARTPAAADGRGRQLTPRRPPR